MKHSAAGEPANDMLTAQYTPVSHEEERPRALSPRSTSFFAWRGRKKKSRPRQAAALFIEYGLEPGDQTQGYDKICNICREGVRGPVVTVCKHTYCFSCIYAWLGRSSLCPDCRRQLKRDWTSDSNTSNTVTPTKGSTERNSTSHEIGTPQSLPIPKSGYYFRARSPDVQELSNRLAALTRQDAAPRTSQDTTSTTSTTSSGSQGSRTWCLQRRSPLRNQAAELNLSYQLRDYNHSSESHRRRNDEQAYTTASSVKSISPEPPSRVKTPSPPSPMLDTFRADKRPHSPPRRPIQDRHPPPVPTITTITVNAEDLLGTMYQMETKLLSKEDVPPLPIRCRAMSKCVWREWRELLHAYQGHEMTIEALIQALIASFQKTVVDYGWATDWKNLDESFVKVVQRIAWSVASAAAPAAAAVSLDDGPTGVVGATT